VSPERLAVACLHDAAANGAAVANYMLVERVERGPEFAVHATDRLSGLPVTIRARSLVNATGPWADLVAPRLGLTAVTPLMRSKGIHLVTRSLTLGHALTVPVEGRHFFVIPWSDGSLIGTTDSPYDGSPDDLTVTEAEIEAFLATINTGLPAANLGRPDVRFAYAGLRPLLASQGTGTYAASRKSGITSDGQGCFTVIGGKWTTSRAVAQRAVDALVHHLGVKVRPCDTAVAPLPDEGHEVRDDSPDLAACLQRAVREDMALTLGDLVFRRTNLGALGVASREKLRGWASLVAAHCHWSPADVERQVDEVVGVYRRASLWPANR
jgi:glycerol-3-phosphate dehydrogenase